jgi:hypothetical protein
MISGPITDHRSPITDHCSLITSPRLRAPDQILKTTTMKTTHKQNLLAAALRECSAGFQPAVSPTSSRQTVRETSRIESSLGVRIGNPRYSRLEVCATIALLAVAACFTPFRAHAADPLSPKGDAVAPAPRLILQITVDQLRGDLPGRYLKHICAKPTPEILKLQADIIAAAKPFMVETGPIGAFTAPHADPATDAALIQYVSTFVPKMSGENYNPHVSTGVASKEYLDQMLAEPFKPFTFSPAGAAVYQLGPFGTAAKKLKQLDLKP